MAAPRRRGRGPARRRARPDGEQPAPRRSRSGAPPAPTAAEENQDPDEGARGHGGARPGAGRPRRDLHLEDFEKFKKPPDKDPLARANWAQNILSVELNRIIKGRTTPEFSDQVRATARAIGSLIPSERLWSAEDEIKKREAKKKRKARRTAELSNVADVGTAPVSGRPPSR